MAPFVDPFTLAIGEQFVPRDSKLVLLDIDETVLRFAEPFEDWLHDTLGIWRSPSLITSGYKIEEWLGCGREFAVELMLAFGKSDAKYLSRPVDNAIMAMNVLRNHGYRIVGVTACGLDQHYAARRTSIIADVFGEIFEGIHYVEHRTSKRDILASFRPAIWVEDNLKNAIEGAEVGHRTFLLDMPYNQGDTGKAARVSGWAEVLANLIPGWPT